MCKVTVVIESMALWVERDTYWEVLFADIAPARQLMGPREQTHEPGVFVNPAVSTLPSLPSQERLLRCKKVAISNLHGMVLDLTASGLPDRQVGAAPDWLVPLPLATGCIALDPNAAMFPNVTGAVRLPFGPIERMNPFSPGPIEVPSELSGGSPRFIYTDYGTVWQSEFDGSPLTVWLRNPRTGESFEEVLTPIDDDIVIRVVNQTASEWLGGVTPLSTGACLTEMLDLYVLAGIPSSTPLPTYEGPIPTPAPSTVSAATLAAAPAATAEDFLIWTSLPVKILSNGSSRCPQTRRR